MIVEKKTKKAFMGIYIIYIYIFYRFIGFQLIFTGNSKTPHFPPFSLGKQQTWDISEG